MQIDFHLLKQIPSLNLKPEVHFRRHCRHLEKSIWRHNSAADRPITTKFGRKMQNDMLMTMHRSKSKPEIEFQYGGRQFSKTGISCISAVDWDISSKFGMQIHFHLLKQIPSQTTYPKVDFRLYGRHLEKSIWRQLCRRSSDYYEIWQSDPKWHADDSTHLKIETSRYLVEIWHADIFPPS